MIVDLNSDAVDEIMKSILLQDYKCLCSDIRRIEQMSNKESFQIQDLEHNYRYRDAMAVLMEYYIGFNWQDQLK